MALFGLPSPSQTRNPSFLSPVEELRNWLASRGLESQEVDLLRHKYDQRLQNIENEQHFLIHLQAIVETMLRESHPRRESRFLTKNELGQIKTSLRSLTSDANMQLHEKSKATGKQICLDALLLLPADKRVMFLSFISNDTANDRLRFINDVLPFLVGRLSEAKNEKQLPNRTPSPPHPGSDRSRRQRLHTTRNLRRSERIRRREDNRQDQMPDDGKNRTRFPKRRPNLA